MKGFLERKDLKSILKNFLISQSNILESKFDKAYYTNGQEKFFYKGYRTVIPFNGFGVEDYYLAFLNEELGFTLEKGVYPKLTFDMKRRKLCFKVNVISDDLFFEPKVIDRINEFNKKLNSFEFDSLIRFSELESKNVNFTSDLLDEIILEIEMMIEFVNSLELKVKWHKVYALISEGLFKYYQKNEDYSGRKLFHDLIRPNDKYNYRKKNKWIGKFQSQWDVPSIDPIHIFASFNYYKIREEDRIELINYYLEVLGSDSKKYKVNEIDFDGIPSPRIDKIVGARSENNQKEIWSFFHDFISQKSIDGKDELIKDISLLERVDQWYGIAKPSITIFLFWLEPKNYLPLDHNTTYALSVSNNFDTMSYVRFLNKIRAEYSFEKVVQSAYEKDQKLYNSNMIEDKKVYRKYKRFEIIAIKPILEGCSKMFRKSLIEDYYFFSNKFKIDGSVLSVEDSFDNFYDVDSDLKININAIVGKNGTGKTTIVELLIAAFNNLSKKLDGNLNIEYVKGINVELFLLLDNPYKISIKDNAIEIYKFLDMGNGVYKFDDANLISTFRLDSFFYNMLLNYSLYGLNSRYYGTWLHKLFHKNDSYQTPIVIEPFRREGNIDVNHLTSLVKERLLVNLLEKSYENEVTDYRKLTKYQFAVSIKISLDLEKVDTIINNGIYQCNYSDFSHEFISLVLQRIFTEFNMNEYNSGVDTINKKTSICNILKLYIFRKVIRICYKYDLYKHYFDLETKTCKFDDEFYALLYEDKSHICYKLKQALNFLKYKETYFKELISEEKLILDEEQSIDIDKFSDAIYSNMLSVNAKDLNHYSLPSIFNFNIYTMEGSSFERLSSGEQQLIYVINSILYQLKNINSVSDNTLHQYEHINIILEEIELYFHPDMQREFINTILENISAHLKKSLLSTIRSINLIFVTHSPFILSDIPSNNIMFLDRVANESIQIKDDNIKTYGANIHELLASAFFLDDGSIGSFALKKINSILKYYDLVLENKVTKEEYLEQKEEFEFIKDSIGEKYIRGVIEDCIKEIDKFFDINVSSDIDLDAIDVVALIHEKNEMEKELSQLRKNNDKN